MRRYLQLAALMAFNCILQPVLGQEVEEKLKDVFVDAEYFFLNEDYREALYSYNLLYKHGFNNNANINYRIGLCYLNISGEKGKSVPYLEKAVESISSKYVEGVFRETKAPVDAYFYLGKAYRTDNLMEKATAAFEQYKSLLDVKNTVGRELADKEIESCKLAVTMMQSPQYIKEENLGRPISTSSRDFFPVVSGDESVLAYNSALKFYNALFFSKKVNNQWSSPINVTPEIESDGNQYCSSLSFDGTELFLRQEDNFDANLLSSKYENGRWTKSASLGKMINTKFWEGNACLTKDKRTLYFSSNKPGGFGALDIYKSERLSDGSWGPAVNLGGVVNSGYNDDAPFISEDGKKLFFVSQGHKTMGGYDIFYSELDDKGYWKAPVNLPYPINTVDDDAFFCPVKEGDAAYVALYSKKGFGYDDIFRIQIAPEKEVTITQTKRQTGNTDSIATAEKTDSVALKLASKLEQQLIKSDSSFNNKELIVIRCLFFDFNSSELTIKTKKELEHLSIVMKNYPDLKIELVGNTDIIGSDKYNLRLSMQRANNAKMYLVSKNIQNERILTRGVGKKNFIAINQNSDGTDNPEGRVYNRRVDVQIQNSVVKSVVVEKIAVPKQLQITP